MTFNIDDLVKRTEDGRIGKIEESLENGEFQIAWIDAEGSYSYVHESELELEEDCGCGGNCKDCKKEDDDDYDDDDYDEEMDESGLVSVSEESSNDEDKVDDDDIDIEKPTDKKKSKKDEEDYEDYEEMDESFQVLAESLGIASDDAIRALRDKFEMMVEMAIETREREIMEEAATLSAKIIKTKLEEQVSETLEAVDLYAEQIAQKWLEENEVEIASSFEQERNSRMVSEMLEVMNKYNFDISESEVDVLEAAQKENDALRAELAERLEENARLQEEMEKIAIIDYVSQKGLSESNKNRVLRLVEGYDFDEKLISKIDDMVNLIEAKEKRSRKSSLNKPALEDDFNNTVDVGKIDEKVNASPEDDYLTSLGF